MFFSLLFNLISLSCSQRLSDESSGIVQIENSAVRDFQNFVENAPIG
jgi:hypothetical protein